MSVISMLILALLVKRNKTLSKSAKHGIIMTAVLVSLCAVMERVGVALNHADSSLRILHIIIKFIELSVAPIIPIAFSNAFYSVKKRYDAFLPAIINTVLLIFSVYYGTIFYVDTNNVYHHGILYAVYYITIFLGVLFLIYTVVSYAVRVQNRNRISLVLILFFVMGAVVLQLFDESIKIVWLTVAIGMILFYIYYCNMILQIDVLTGLLNRRSYDAQLQITKVPAVIIFFDINDFKGINDCYGHGYGDECLKTIGKAIRQTYGINGLCYRIGGDEFCAILDRHTDTLDIDVLNGNFERILKEIHKDDSCFPTVALGYSWFNSKTMNIEEAIEEADSKMYNNKRER